MSELPTGAGTGAAPTPGEKRDPSTTLGPAAPSGMHNTQMTARANGEMNSPLQIHIQEGRRGAAPPRGEKKDGDVALPATRRLVPQDLIWLEAGSQVTAERRK
jgi:hypothetical protein